ICRGAFRGRPVRARRPPPASSTRVVAGLTIGRITCLWTESPMKHLPHGASLSRRAFMFLAGLATLALGRSRPAAAGEPAGPGLQAPVAPAQADEWDRLLAEALRFPLFSALFGRRSRRFGWGMEIPRGPLAFRSD